MAAVLLSACFRRPQSQLRHPPRSPPEPAQPPLTAMTCSSALGERTQCAADTSAGVVLVRSTGAAPCLLGRTWGYDQTSIWVSDGCSAEFAHRRRRDSGRRRSPGPVAHPERRLSALRRRQGADIFPAVHLRAISESAEPGRVLRRRLRQHEDRSAAPGHPAAEVLRAVLGVVPHAEDPLLPLRLVVERIAGRSGAGRRRGQHDSWTFNRFVSVGVGITSLPSRPKHRGPVPVLAWRGRPPDCRRVLSRVVHVRRLAQGRVPLPSSSTW